MNALQKWMEEVRGNDAFKQWVRKLPAPTPDEMSRKLEEIGYRGQDRARQAVCLMAYRHIRRIKSVFLSKSQKAEFGPKNNLILIGPTGCGKTHLIELLFGKILKIPFAMIDLTKYTEVGYVGND